jgi:predicted nucleic acid-binding protein
MIAVIDANIALALLLELAYSAKARDAVTKADVMIAPDLIIHETANALWRISTAEIAFGEQAAEIIRTIPALFEEIIQGGDLASDALQLAILGKHPAYDCFYIALAKARGAALITADRKLAAAASRIAPEIVVILVQQ